MDFGEIAAVLLDLDGVMYRGAKLCNGAAAFVAAARARGIRTMFLSNNSRSGPETVAAKLTELGVATSVAEVVTAAELMVAYMARQQPTTVAVIGSAWLSEQLLGQGWALPTAGSQPDYLLVGLDHQFTYPKLLMGVEALLAGARFVAANRDPVNPIDGTLEPGCGALVAALEAATSRKAKCIGKPSLAILRKALKRIDVQPANALMIGDSLVSDMVLARRGGTRSALVLSGQTSHAMVERLPANRRPDIVARDLAHLGDLWH